MKLKLIPVLTIFLAVSAILNLRFENILEPDSFYHLRHAWIYRTSGIFDSSFPWAQFSVIKTAGADLWYGFHIFLIPLTFINDPAVAVKISGFLITFLAAICLYAALKRLFDSQSQDSSGFINPLLWTIFFLFSSPAIMQRMTFVRPHPLSLGLMAMIFSYFTAGSAASIFVFSFILSWVHSSLFWFPLITVGVLALVKRCRNQEAGLRKLEALFGGIALGLLARPHPLANLKLIYIQVVDLYLAKNNELAQVIGGELRPPTWDGVLSQKWLLIVLAISVIYFVRRIASARSARQIEPVPGVDGKVVVLSSLILIGLSAFMYATARRAIDQLGLFITVFAGSVFLGADRFTKLRLTRLRKPQILLILILSISAYNLIYANPGSSHSPAEFKESALWLKENTNKGEIVFHANWSHFPFLFFWNQNNYYINGMDPVFLLEYDEKLYWKLYNISVNENDKKKYWKLDGVSLNDLGGITCGRDPIKCGPRNIERVADVLRNDFNASYIFAAETNRAKFLDYLGKDVGNFKKIYENEKEGTLIFKVL